MVVTVMREWSLICTFEKSEKILVCFVCRWKCRRSICGCGLHRRAILRWNNGRTIPRFWYTLDVPTRQWYAAVVVNFWTIITGHCSGPNRAVGWFVCVWTDCVPLFRRYAETNPKLNSTNPKHISNISLWNSEPLGIVDSNCRTKWPLI